jgi:hypothetical protein
MQPPMRWSMIVPLADIARQHSKCIPDCTRDLLAYQHELSQAQAEDEILTLRAKVFSLQEQIFEHSAISIIFSAMTVEGYIYDYGARNLSDTYMEHLDKLDTVSKWIVIPRLITGKELSRDRKAFAMLRNLIKERNALVHVKSLPADCTDQEQVMQQIRKDELFPQKAQDAVATLGELAKELQSIDPNEPFLLFFLESASQESFS